MAKLNISFNGADYLIDESDLIATISVLQSHFSTVMNGSGETITLNGTSYNVDATKLSVAKNDFVSHLGTIAGNGSKVKVNGVEYPVDTAKVSDATAELHAVLGGMISGGGEEEDTIAAGLYETGSNYATLLTSWEDLLANGTVHVEDGVVYTNLDTNEWENASSDALAGDLMLPHDGTITALGDLAWDDTIYNEEYDEYGAYTGNAAFGYCCNLTDIVIPDSVTTIGESAFEGCESLHSINIPAGIATISDYAFSSCGITSIEIPDSVTTIDCVFCGCYNLTSITIPDSVTSIGEAFYECTSLTTIIFKGTIAQWNDIVKDEGWNYNAPISCIQCSDGTIQYTAPGLYQTGSNYTVLLKSWADLLAEGTVHVEDGVVYTNSVAGTSGNASASVLAGDLMLPNDGSITALGDNAFSYCFGLTNIEIPDSITSIGSGAFEGCESLVTTSYDNAVYLGNSNNPYIVLYGAVDGTVTACEINENTKYIHSQAFDNCRNLVSVTFGENSQLTSIGEHAFGNCYALTSIEIPASVTTIYSNAFFCSGELSVTFGANSQLTAIGEWAFYRSSISSIEIPASVKTIGKQAFDDCHSLANITFKGTMSQWDAIFKGGWWNEDVPATTVQCSDGTVTI